jgi:hypothetical protein
MVYLLVMKGPVDPVLPDPMVRLIWDRDVLAKEMKGQHAGEP